MKFKKRSHLIVQICWSDSKIFHLVLSDPIFIYLWYWINKTVLLFTFLFAVEFSISTHSFLVHPGPMLHLLCAYWELHIHLTAQQYLIKSSFSFNFIFYGAEHVRMSHISPMVSRITIAMCIHNFRNGNWVLIIFSR